MDHRDEVRTFRTSRRAKPSPEQAGLTVHARSGRRVPGLRRGEVADLAGVSVEYYARLERGGLAGVSDSVLDALARALQLSEDEHAHLLDLARASGPGRRAPRRPAPRQVPASIRRVLDGMTGIPAFVRDGRLHRTGLKHFDHPVVGRIHLAYDAMALPVETGLTLTAFSAEAGTPDGDALRLLASWAAAAPLGAPRS